jgi:hypothetical protein
VASETPEQGRNNHPQSRTPSGFFTKETVAAMAWKSREDMLAYNRDYYAKNREAILAKQKDWRQANAATVAKRSHERYVKNREKASAERKTRYSRKKALEREQQRIYREKHRQQIRDQQREYRAANRDELNRKARERRAADPEKYRERDLARRSTPEARAAAVERMRRWVACNKERHLEWMRRRRKARMQSDPEYKASIAMRRRFYMALRNQVYDGWNIRSGEAVRLLGCTMAEFVSHVESLWLPGMSWDNWSCDGWHIDHIMPMAAFDLTDEGQRKKACHYTNLRPLWAKDNLAKGSKVGG